MATAQAITMFIYNIALIPMIFLSLVFLTMSIINIFVDKKKNFVDSKTYKFKEWPFVSVQVPSFNDPIAARCIEGCMKLDYPKDRFEVMILDDSTNTNTQALLKKYADDNPGFVKYIHRTNRQGYKPGACKDAMDQTKGEIICIFDSDWEPEAHFLKKVIPPFADPKIAIVQGGQGFSNKDTNIITRFAAYSLTIFHTIIMPISNKINTVFFCGTGGAIRKKCIEEVGGWNPNSITEDSELSVRILMKGYKSVYVKGLDQPSEVPDTWESYIKQQMRWTYGGMRVFLDNYQDILFSGKLNWKQQAMIMFQTMVHLIAPVVITMTIFGFVGWFVGEPSLFNMSDVATFFLRFFYTFGFLLMGGFMMYKRHMLNEYWYLVRGCFTVSIVLVFAIAYAAFKALFNQKLSWFCTPKIKNTDFV